MKIYSYKVLRVTECKFWTVYIYTASWVVQYWGLRIPDPLQIQMLYLTDIFIRWHSLPKDPNVFKNGPFMVVKLWKTLTIQTSKNQLTRCFCVVFGSQDLSCGCFLGQTSCDSSWTFPAQQAARSRYIPKVSDRNHPLADRAGQRTNEPSVTIDRFYRFHPGWKYRMEFWKNLENQHWLIWTTFLTWNSIANCLADGLLLHFP